MLRIAGGNPTSPRRGEVGRLASNSGTFNHLVMPGLVPGIHVSCQTRKEDVDGRDEPGHDEK
jgi:hypothetical protein